MKTTIYRAILASFFLCSMVISSQATDIKHHHPGDEATMSSNEMHGMKRQKMKTMQRPPFVFAHGGFGQTMVQWGILHVGTPLLWGAKCGPPL